MGRLGRLGRLGWLGPLKRLGWLGRLGLLSSHSIRGRWLSLEFTAVGVTAHTKPGQLTRTKRVEYVCWGW